MNNIIEEARTFIEESKTNFIKINLNPEDDEYSFAVKYDSYDKDAINVILDLADLVTSKYKNVIHKQNNMDNYKTLVYSFAGSLDDMKDILKLINESGEKFSILKSFPLLRETINLNVNDDKLKYTFKVKNTGNIKQFKGSTSKFMGFLTTYKDKDLLSYTSVQSDKNDDVTFVVTFKDTTTRDKILNHPTLFNDANYPIKVIL